jgi:hypothetical protein
MLSDARNKIYDKDGRETIFDGTKETATRRQEPGYCIRRNLKP